MELRVTLPLLGTLTKTGVWTVAIWNPITGFLTFYLLAVLASEALGDSTAAALFVLGLGPTFFGAWFFNDFIFGDGIPWLLMLLSIAWPLPLVTALAFLAAAFCDERCVTALPLLMTYTAIRFREPGQSSKRNRTFAAFAAALAAWLILRWVLIHHFGDSAGTSGIIPKQTLRFHLMESLPGTFLGVFRSSWMLPVFTLLSLFASQRHRLLAIVTASFGIPLLPAFLVWDFDRSVAYTFIVLLISLYTLRGAPALSRKYLAAMLVMNIILTVPGKSIIRAIDWF
jgi:hypothetical protein